MKKLQKLAQLDLSENPIASKPDYRKKVFEMFESLDILDNKDADGQSIVYGDPEGGEEGDFEGEGAWDGEEELSEGDEEGFDYEEEGEEAFGDEEDDDDEDAAPQPQKKLKK